ncbi:uridine kinase [Legionella sp. W05-934-2]|uniref:uridine kinase family protein n=1 Tax=Legionella sp. W05-934-2 TaxID=1198649 RepID=UPI00346360AD
MLFIFIGGGSGIGKSEITEQLGILLEGSGFVVKALSMDNYYKERPDKLSVEEYSKITNFDAPDSLQLGKLRDDLKDLAGGKTISQPQYSFKTQQSIGTVLVDPTGTDIFIIEGIYALKIAQMVKEINKFNIYVAPSMYFDMVQQRINRDTKGDRGNRTPEFIRQLESTKVGPGFFSYVANTSNCADLWLTNTKALSPEKGKEECSLLAQSAFKEIQQRLPCKQVKEEERSFSHKA